MTLTFNIPIRIRPDATIKGMYTGRTYTASEELDNALEVMALLERGQYLFSQHRSTYTVAVHDCEIIDAATPV